jgi:hypothetical protein
MIERFNFYDIYGYILPGTLLLGLFWLPFGMSKGAWPTQEISTTLLLLAMAYIVGHLLQTVASVAVQSDVKDGSGVLRAPSSVLLDEGSLKFSRRFRDDLSIKIQNAFGIDVLGNGEDALLNRNAAFLQARAYLIRNKAANYVEQFEGLYAMMRGLGSAFFTGTAYLFGWVLSFHWQTRFLGAGIWMALVASAVASLLLTAAFFVFKESKNAERTRDRWLAVCFVVFVLGAGYFLGTWKPLPGRLEFFLWMVLPVTLVAGSRCLKAYRGYAQHFAETVWRDFSGIYREDAPSFKESD